MVDQLLAESKKVLGEQFLGLYLFGSLSTGDFNPESSDIDFLCTTADKLSEETIAALEKMFFDLEEFDPKWWYKLEGSFTPQADMYRYNPENGPYPTVHEGKFYLAGHESHWIIQRHLLLKNAVIVEGYEPSTFIAPVNVDDLHGALRSFLDEWWIPMLDNPVKLDRQDYQAYAILTMCRMLYTFENDEIASKPVSARWAQENFPEWHELVGWALEWKEDRVFDDKKNETMGFIQFAVDYSKRINMDAKTFVSEIKAFSTEYKKWWCEPFEKFDNEYRENRDPNLPWQESIEKRKQAVEEFRKKRLLEDDPISRFYVFFDNYYYVYLDATPEERADIRKLVKDIYCINNKTANITRFMSDVLLQYANKWVVAKMRYTGEEEWLLRGLTAVSIENGSVDYRDSMLSLAKVYVAARDKNIAPFPLMKKVANVSSDEKPAGCSDTMKTLMVGIHTTAFPREFLYDEE